MTKASISIFALAAASAVVSAQTYVNPSTSPFEQSDNYVGRSNGTILNSPLVPGAQFDRFIQSEFNILEPVCLSSSACRLNSRLGEHWLQYRKFESDFPKVGRAGITLTDVRSFIEFTKPPTDVF